MKLTLTLQLELEPDQLSPSLAQHLAGLVACVNQAPETEPQPLPEPPKRRRGRPPKADPPIIVSPDAWQQFDGLVREEMKRLADNERMPDHRRWNNERDVRLPTMAQLFTGYEVANILQLAHKLEMRPPLSALGVAAYATGPGPGTEVTDEQ